MNLIFLVIFDLSYKNKETPFSTLKTAFSDFYYLSRCRNSLIRNELGYDILSISYSLCGNDHRDHKIKHFA